MNKNKKKFLIVNRKIHKIDFSYNKMQNLFIKIKSLLNNKFLFRFDTDIYLYIFVYFFLSYEYLDMVYSCLTEDTTFGFSMEDSVLSSESICCFSST